MCLMLIEIKPKQSYKTRLFPKIFYNCLLLFDAPWTIVSFIKFNIYNIFNEYNYFIAN